MTDVDTLGHRRYESGRIEHVTDEVRAAIGFHLGSVIQVETPDGAVVVDSTGGARNAARARDALAAERRVDTKHLVYTHCHPDHCGGAGELTGDRTEHVIAQALLPGLWERDMDCLWPWHRRVRSWQTGRPVEAGGEYSDGNEGDRAYLAPTLTFDRQLDVEVGGLTFHLEHTEGETRDHLLVWIPELKVLLPGDLFYPAFPNLSTPAIGPRPVTGWIESLSRMLDLGADHLVPSHGPPVSGADDVRDALTGYRDAITYVRDASMQALNDGLSVHEAARTIRLPAELAAKPYLAERYGTVAWGVRAVYDGLTGWYDGDPSSLDPLPASRRDAVLVELSGRDALVARARAYAAEGEHQLALELLSVLLSAEPGHAEANRVQAEVCRELARTSPSINQKGFYASAARVAETRMAGLDT